MFILSVCNFSSVESAELDILDAYIVMLKPETPLEVVAKRVRTRNADPKELGFSANIDPKTVFSANKAMSGFRMIATADAADQMRKEPEVRLVERDSAISVDEY